MTNTTTITTINLYTPTWFILLDILIKEKDKRKNKQEHKKTESETRTKIEQVCNPFLKMQVCLSFALS